MPEDRGARQRALLITRRYSRYCLGAGLLPLPWVDVAAASVIQLNMIVAIAAEYGEPFAADHSGRALIASLAGGVGAARLGGALLPSVAKAVPGVGWLAGGISGSAAGYATTYGLGLTFIEYFEEQARCRLRLQQPGTP